MKSSKCAAIGPLSLPCAYCNGSCIALTADALDLEIKLDRVTSVACTPETILYVQGTAAVNVFVIRRGLVKLVYYLANGHSRIVRLFRDEDVVGLEGLVDGAYHATAIAVSDVNACIIPVPEIRKWDASEPRFHQLLMKRWQVYLDQADGIITQLSTGTAQARMARLLLYMLNRRGASGNECLCDALSREDMGAFLGLTTETASRIFAMFKRQGFVERQIGPFFRCNATGLKKLAQI